jgi:Ca2+-binding EF-hand superfamily protein
MTPVASESSLDVSSTEPPSHQWHFSPDMDKDEFKNMVKEMFEHADENKNGVLVLSEFKQFALFAL